MNGIAGCLGCYITISPTLFLTCSRACPGLLPHFSHLSLERPGKTGRSVGEVLDESGRRSELGFMGFMRWMGSDDETHCSGVV